MLRPFLLATLTVPFSWVEAWLTMQSTLHPEVKTYPTQRSTTRWDKHLDLAKSAYRRRHWGQVRQICSRVINVSAASHEVAACQDWAAVEQAHLRLALAEQQDKQVDAARRTFQVRASTRDRVYGGKILEHHASPSINTPCFIAIPILPRTPRLSPRPQYRRTTHTWRLDSR